MRLRPTIVVLAAGRGSRFHGATPKLEQPLGDSTVLGCTLARAIGLDTSTTADICARLEAKGWIHRELLPRRQRALSLTPEGEAVLASLVPHLRVMNKALLSRLDAGERSEFMRLLRKFVQVNNEQSRAPMRSAADQA